MLWQTVRQHHPGVDDGAAWDAAVARLIPAIRAAGDEPALSAAITVLLAVLQDPATRVERRSTRSTIIGVRNGGAAVRTEFLPGADSVLLVRVTPSAAYAKGDSIAITQAIAHNPERVVIDVRGAEGDGNSFSRDAADALLHRTGLVSSLISTPLALGQQRTRVSAEPAVDTAAFLSGAPDASERAASVLLQEYGTLPASARRTTRAAVVVNRHSVMPRHLAAMVAAGRAWLVSEGRLDGDLLASSVIVSADESVTVRVRTGEMLFPPSLHALRADTVVPATSPAGDGSSEALRAAVVLLRSSRIPQASASSASGSVSSAHSANSGATDTLPYPYMGARLLAAFKVWSIMRTQHAHQGTYDDDIDAVFARAIPRVESAQNREQYVRALGDLIASFDDSQVRLERRSTDSRAGDASAPFRTRVVEGRMIVTSMRPGASVPGIAVGSEITAADGYPIAAWMQEHRRDMPASNDWARNRDLAELLSRGPKGNATFKVRDASGPERTVAVLRTPLSAAEHNSRERIAERTAAPSRTIGEVAYFDLSRLDEEAASRDFVSLGNARATILDLRGTLALSPEMVLHRFAVRPAFTPARIVSRPVSSVCTVPLLRDVARLCPDERITMPVTLHGDSSTAFRGRVVLLIDERTQDAAERLALALETGANAALIGTASAGAAAPTRAALRPRQCSRG